MSLAKSLYLSILFLLTTTLSKSQIIEDFSDGDFSNNPTWVSSNETGQGADFQVANGELQSNGPSATATIWISTTDIGDVSVDKTIWTFKVRYSNAPSGSNNIRIYLMSDQTDLTTTTEGYYIQLGEGGSGDGIDFYKTSSGMPLIEDDVNLVAAEIDVNIRVTRETNGDWLLEADTGTGFSTIGTVNDNEFTIGDNFGFVVDHTSSRNQDFFFDDITVAPGDIFPPTLADIEVVSNTELNLNFSEPLDPITTENILNYSVNNDIGTPEIATLNTENPSQVYLSFSNQFPSGVSYELTVSNVEDLNGNSLNEQIETFLFFEPVSAAFKDVIINEIFADPDPPNDLPEVEFVELYNNSDKTFDLKDWTFSDVTNAGTFTNQFFFPGGYLILCSASEVDKLEQYGEVMGLSTWPSLNNSGDQLAIRDNAGVTVDSINYSNEWYTSSTKREGGWSLEIIDPNNDCGEEENWTASENPAGGTPGSQNSVFSQNPDLSGPRLEQAFALSADSISLLFNEKLDPTTVNTATFQITPQVDITGRQLSNSLKELVIILPDPLERKISYKVVVNNLLDCGGNNIDKGANSATFALPENAEVADVIINELLFNPRSGGVDFVEIYNRSDKYINIKDWGLFNGGRENDSLIIQTERSISDTNFIVAPGSYSVLTGDALVLKEQYPLGRENVFQELSSLPSYPNEKGIVGLLKYGTVIDVFDYSEDYHSSLLDNVDGVSLERVSFETVTNTPDNWKSAVASTGFATPGYRNSQALENISSVTGDIVIEPKVIIPDGSGHQDFTTITYEFDRPGFVATVKIIDIQGREIKQLANNHFLAADGFYTWDGTDEKGRKVRVGYYLVSFEVFNNNGDTNHFKKKVVVGSKF